MRGRAGKNSLCIFLFTVCLLSLAAGAVHADQAELDQVKRAITARGARWHAEETSISRLSPEERRMRLGLDESAVSDFSPDTAIIPMVTATPPTLDWRNINGVSYITPVKNQGSCGSCWAFAVTGALESQVMIDSAGMPMDLSEQILLSCSGAGTCSGGSSAKASDFIRDTGLPVESCFQYSGTNNSCSNACADWQSATYSVMAWHAASTSAATVEDLKNALYAYGPVVATMYVYNDFYYYRSGVYTYTSGAYLGAHAVLVVGYDDENQCFIVKNSWGSGWGEAGYFLIAYSEMTGTSRFGYSVLVYDGYADTPAPAPAPACSYSLSSTGKTFKPAGGRGSFSIYTQADCSWTAETSAPWVRVTSPPNGAGTGTITYTVDPNTGPARKAVITAGGLNFIINQQQSRK
jgi:C1A family cysteine protease